MKKIFIVMIAVVGMVACDDIFEKELTDEVVHIVGPTDGVTIPAGEVMFSWSAVNGASAYHFRLVGGRFNHSARPILDTVMYNDSTGVRRNLKKQLSGGEYQWSIKAMNSAYETAASISTLYVQEPEPEE